MAVGRGIDYRAALAKGSTWGTLPSDPTTDALRPQVSSTIATSGGQLIQNEELNDSAGRGAAAVGNEDITGTWASNLHYQGQELEHALAFGTAGSPTQVGTTSYYTHRLLIKSSLQGIFGAIFEDREISTYEVDSVKAGALRVSGSIGERVQQEVDWVGNDLDVAGDITWGSVTQNANAINNHVLMSDGTFYWNANSAGDPTSGSEVGIEAFTFELNNNLDVWRTTADAPNIAEPVRGGFVSCSGSFTVPTYEANTYVTELLTKPLNKFVLQFVSSSYSYKIFVPGFRWTNPSPTVDGPQRVPQELTWEYEKVTSNPTGFNSTLPYVEITSQESADPLA